MFFQSQLTKVHGDCLLQPSNWKNCRTRYSLRVIRMMHMVSLLGRLEYIMLKMHIMHAAILFFCAYNMLTFLLPILFCLQDHNDISASQ